MHESTTFATQVGRVTGGADQNQHGSGGAGPATRLQPGPLLRVTHKRPSAGIFTQKSCHLLAGQAEAAAPIWEMIAEERK